MKERNIETKPQEQLTVTEPPATEPTVAPAQRQWVTPAFHRVLLDKALSGDGGATDIDAYAS
jgi:hypothetical protein